MCQVLLRAEEELGGILVRVGPLDVVCKSFDIGRDGVDVNESWDIGVEKRSEADGWSDAERVASKKGGFR